MVRLARLICLGFTLFGVAQAIVAAGSADKVGVTTAQLLARAASKGHPRTLQVSYPSVKTEVLSRADRLTSAPLPAAPDVGADKAKREAKQISFAEEDRLLLAALLWQRTKQERFLTEARRRAHNLAGWPARGATGFFQNDFAGHAVAWALALTYDWLHDQLSEAERARLLAAIRPRVEDMLSPPVKNLPTGWAGLDWGRKLDRWPYDSHGAVTLARLAVICTVLAGEDPLFDRCFEAVVPRYLARPIPWGETGGYANGTAYAQWDVLFTHFMVWDLLRNALGVDLWQSDWARGYVRFIAYFLPPGTPTGLFGDGAEQRHAGVWATQAKAYAAHLPSPLADWYARNQFGENPAHLALLLAPARDWNAIPGALPAGTPHAAHLEDTGWVAMHSDLGDRARTSVYFKSSPYGSYNHSHADQNSFVIHAKGRALAIDSGYYDSYGSPHWREWYKQTRAHNAITFDGGQGQLHDSMAAKGRITRFEHHADYDIAIGDATAAYGGALTRAVRSLIYLRPDTLLVFDNLASGTPRTWEWSLHARSRMKEQGARTLEIDDGGVRLCVSMLEAPEGRFTQTDRFTAEPQGQYPAQWHARYATTAKSREARFVALLEVGCGGAEATLRRDGDRVSVEIAGRLVSFAGAQVEVAK